MIPTSDMLEFADAVVSEVMTIKPSEVKKLDTIDRYSNFLEVVGKGNNILLAHAKISFGDHRVTDVHALGFAGIPKSPQGDFDAGFSFIAEDKRMGKIGFVLFPIERYVGKSGKKFIDILRNNVVHELVHAGGVGEDHKCERRLSSIRKKMKKVSDSGGNIDDLIALEHKTYMTFSAEVEAYEAERIADAIFYIKNERNKQKAIGQVIEYIDAFEKACKLKWILNTPFSHIDEVWINEPKIWKRFIKNFRKAIDSLQ